MLQALASAAVLGGVSTTLGHAQGMSGTWLQCRDAAISENGGPQRPDTGFDEILLVNLTTGSVSGYSSDDRSLTPYARDGAGGGATLRWQAERIEPTGQCSFTSRTEHTLQPKALRYATENTYTMVCRDKAPLTHVTRRDASCRPIEPLPLAPRKL